MKNKILFGLVARIGSFHARVVLGHDLNPRNKVLNVQLEA
jgi:hypothetical protein